MSGTSLKNYEFERYLLENVKLFDEVLRELDEPPLFENQNFTVAENFDLTPDYSVNYLIMESTNKTKNSLPIRILFEGNNLRIDIDGVPEIFQWAAKHIEEDRNSVVELIRNLFTGFISIETRNSSKFVQIFDAGGFFVQQLSYNNLFHILTGLYLFRYKNYRRLYLPLFSKKK